MFTLSAASADRVSIAYESYGTGTPALVFIHGWACNRSYWYVQLQELSQEFKVVALDLASHGQSDRRENWTISGAGEDVAAVVNELDLQRVILIGHSMGGDVSLAAAHLLRNRVIGLIWVDTYPGNRLRTCAARLRILNEVSIGDFETNVRAMVKNLFKNRRDPALQQMADLMSSASPTIARNILTESLAFADEVRDHLRELKPRLFAINGWYGNRSDDLDPTPLPVFKTRTMKSAKHFPHLEDPREFNHILRAFIKEAAR